MNKNKKIAIIGAGISGLTIANKLKDIAQVTIFEKSKGIGGRMSNRRHENYSFDHGAQFFTAKTAEFKDFCQNKVIEVWKARFAEIDGSKIKRKWSFNESHPHFVGVPQMNSMCKLMAEGLNIKRGVKIDKIEFYNKKWQLTDENSQIFQDFDYLIISAPLEQTKELVKNYTDIIENMNLREMLPCFSLMIGLNKDFDFGFDAALVKNSIISWISSNRSKPKREGGFTLLVNSSNIWAQNNIDIHKSEVSKQLTLQLQKIINFKDSDIVHQNIHLWRYANAKFINGPLSLFEKNINLGICGDWLMSGRVEHAFLSAYDLEKKFDLKKVSTNLTS